MNFTVAGLAQGIAAPIIAGFAGRFLPFGQYNAPAISAGTGWLLSKVFEMFGFTRRFSDAALILGFSTAVIQITSPFVGRLVAGAGQQTGMGRWGQRGMQGIGIMTNIPPGYALPPAAQAAQRGMQGVGVMTNVPPGYAR